MGLEAPLRVGSLYFNQWRERNESPKQSFPITESYYRFTPNVPHYILGSCEGREIMCDSSVILGSMLCSLEAEESGKLPHRNRFQNPEAGWT